MRKPVTMLVALLLMVVAVLQAARAFMAIDVTVGTFHVPVMTSWIAAAVAAVLSFLLLGEARRR